MYVASIAARPRYSSSPTDFGIAELELAMIRQTTVPAAEKAAAKQPSKPTYTPPKLEKLEQLTQVTGAPVVTGAA